MANLSNINNNFIVTDDGVGRVLIGATGTPTSALTISGQQELLQLTRGGASDTKWFFSADSTRLFVAENTSASTNVKVAINKNGNFGIGTDLPVVELQVNAGSGYAETRLIGASGSGGTLELYDNTTKLADIYADPAKKLYFRTNGQTTALTLDDNQDATFSGKIIGQDSASVQLELSRGTGSNENTSIKFVQTLGNGFFGVNSNGALSFGTAANLVTDNKFKVERSGNATFAGSITVGGGNSVINGDLYFGPNADIFKNSGTLKISTVEGIEYQVRSTNGSTGDHIFKSFNTAILTLDGGSNNVGIGTTSPDANLHIDKDDASPVLLVKASDQTGSTTPFSKLVLAAGSATGADVGSNIMGYRTADFSSAAARSTGLKFGVLQNNVAKDAMWINEAQNVGIGTDEPDTTFHVKGISSFEETTAGAGTRLRLMGQDSSGQFNFLIGKQFNVNNTFEITPSTTVNGTTFSNPAFVIKSDGNVGIGVDAPNDGKLQVYGNSNSQWGTYIFNQNAGGIGLHVETNSFGTEQLLRLSSLTGSGGSNIVRMAVLASGVVLVGQSTANDNGNGFGVYPAGSSGGCLVNCYNGDDGTALRVGRNSDGSLITFIRNTTPVGSISVTENSTSFNETSDYRLKEDLKDFAGLDMVSKIPVYDFKWKTDKSRSYGVVAHELEEVLPQAVFGEKDAKEMQQVDYSKIIPLLVKSIQELKAEVDLLKNK